MRSTAVLGIKYLTQKHAASRDFYKKLPKWAPKGKPKPWMQRLMKWRTQRGPSRISLPNLKTSSEMSDRSQSAVSEIRNPTMARSPDEKWTVLRGDFVHVIKRGRDIGKRGKIIEVLRKSNKVVVQGVGMVKTNIQGTDGSVREVTTEGPISRSDVMLVCPRTGVPTKVDVKYIDGVTAVRVAKVSGAIIPRPEILRQRRKPRPGGERDTEPGAVLAMTYEEPEMVTKARETLRSFILEHQKRIFNAAEQEYEKKAGRELFKEYADDGKELQKEFDELDRQEVRKLYTERKQKEEAEYVAEQLALDEKEKEEIRQKQVGERRESDQPVLPTTAKYSETTKRAR